MVIGVRLGEYDLRNTEDCEEGYCAPKVQDFRAEKMMIHPNYNKRTYTNDIALIRLDYNANFSYSNIKPICLPVSEINDDLTGKSAIVSGWGATEKGYKSPILLKVSVPVLSLSVCHKVYQQFAPITDQQICAGGYNGRDSCGGDSGGPMKYVGLVDGSPRY
ncbi:phenoloxidase-activating factor 3-like, partial [Cylas formicarius]|uniref:phenoloxidase-activating factor 3-like n=1 Tax=Cylas formicarius TaxID=197179 RepID=UPI00295871D9